LPVSVIEHPLRDTERSIGVRHAAVHSRLQQHFFDLLARQSVALCASEVHRELVARHELRAYDVPANGLPSEHLPTRREAALRKFAGVVATEAN